MKRSFAIAGSIALISLLTFVHSVFAQRGRGLLNNPEFAEGGGSYQGWTFDPALASGGAVAVERAAESRSGYALRLSPNSRNTNKDKPLGIGQIVPLGEWAGHRLTVSASIKSEGAFGVVLAFALDSKGRPVANTVLQQLDPSTGFQPQRAQFDVPKSADKLLVGLVTPSTSGSVWFADVYAGADTLNPGLHQRNPTVSVPAPSSNATASASIEINASHMIRPVPTLMFGTNVEWVRNANTLWDERSNAPRAEIVSRAKELGVTAVRYPGGGFADYYHWRDGIGPLATRPVRPHVLDSGQGRVIFGTHELMRFCRDLGAEPVIQTNVVTGTAQEAADWVAYCNRRDAPERTKNGSPEPFHIRNWEIGNEQYIKPDGGLATPANSYMAPEEYAERFKRFATAMRAVDPTIRLGAVSGHNFGLYRLLHDENWEQVLLQRVGGQIDFLSVHNGYAPLLVTNQNGGSPEDVYRAMLAFPLQVERNLKQIGDDITKYAGPNESHIGIAVTEWGPLFAFLPSSPYVDHQKTLGSALYVASLMQTFLRTPRVEMANFFKLTEGNFMGWINGPDAEPKPIYYALEMYSRHFGTKVVESSVAGPSYSSQQIGLVMAETSVPVLDSIASLSDDGSHLYLIVVNKNLTDSVAASIKMTDYSPKPSAKVWVLTAPSLDANNGADMSYRSPQAKAASHPMFDDGHPGTVRPATKDFTAAAAQCKFTFEPHSITAIEFAKAQ